MIIHGCYLYLFISFYILKIFHNSHLLLLFYYFLYMEHLLLLDIVKHDIKNSYKRKCLCKNYKPKKRVSFDETDYSWTANSQRVTEEL